MLGPKGRSLTARIPKGAPVSTRNVIIIGSGPAGLTAAIYTARANLAPLVIEGEPSSTSDQPGGQLMLTTEVENYPGFPDGIMGPELMANFRAQAARFGAEFRTEKVTRVDLSSRPVRRLGRRPDARRADLPGRAVIVSTGAQSLMLGSTERGPSCSATACRRAPPATASSSAATTSPWSAAATRPSRRRIFLTKFADKVTVVHRRDELRASKIMQERAFKNDKIDVPVEHTSSSCSATTKLEGVGRRGRA